MDDCQCEQMKEVERRLDEGDAAFEDLREMVGDIQEKVGRMVDIFTAGEGFFRVIGWIGKGIKWVSGILLAVAGIYAMLKGFVWK